MQVLDRINVKDLRERTSCQFVVLSDKEEDPHLFPLSLIFPWIGKP